MRNRPALLTHLGALVASLVFLVPSLAQAATVQHTSTLTPLIDGSGWGPRTVRLLFDETDPNPRGSELEAFTRGTFAHPKFDASLGELQSAAFVIDFTAQVESELVCGEACFPTSIPLSHYWFGSLRLQVFDASPFLFIGETVEHQNQDDYVFECDATCYLLQSFDRSSEMTFTDGLDRFLGPGPLDLDWSISETFTRGGIVEFDTTVEITITSTYTYVPEPGSGILLSCGILAMAVQRRAHHRG